MKKKRNYYLRIGTALVLLCNPNIHVIDVLPDFIAYFIIFSLISEAADLAPHFAQARDSAKKLALLGLFKIPAAFLILVARSNNTMDSNLIPTFAIVFAVFEMIFGYVFLYHISEALFYLGERSDATALISPFHILTPKKKEIPARAIFYRNQQPEVLRNLSFLFLFVKAFASFLPELLLLTRKQEFVGDYTEQTKLMRLYPYMLILALIMVFAIGIYWLFLSRAYLRAVRTEGKFFTALHMLAGEDLIKQKEKRELCSAHILAFSLFAIATLFSLNFMPIFCFSLFLMLGACWMRTPKKLNLSARIFGTLSILTSLLQVLFLEKFEYDYGYNRLLTSAEAKSAYMPCVAAACINTAMLLALLITVYKSLHHVIYGTLGLPQNSERYSRTDRKYHRELSRFNLIFLLFGSLSVICRGIYIYLRGQVIFIPSSSTAVGTISHQFEFWPLVLVGIAIPYIIFAFYYMGILKEEIKFSKNEL